MDKKHVMLVTVSILFAFVILGAISVPLGLTVENSRYFFGLGGMILGYAIGKMKIENK